MWNNYNWKFSKLRMEVYCNNAHQNEVLLKGTRSQKAFYPPQSSTPAIRLRGRQTPAFMLSVGKRVVTHSGAEHA